ncbi:MAG: membrane protein insertase YidC [Candidatus Omnitrophica bacterium]|nr:membrane protein insertase YidC [Candidatus Omnitrophota bacterium]
MEKRLLIALGLSLAVLFLFQKMSPKGPVTGAPEKGATVQMEELAAFDSRGAEKNTPAVRPMQTAEKVKEEETVIETGKYRLVFSNIGGSLKKVVLKEYSGKEEEVLQQTKDPAQSPFALKSPVFPGIEKAPYSVSKGEGYLEYSLQQPGEIQIKKRYTFDNSNDYIGLTLLVENLSKKQINFSYEIVGPAGMVNGDEVSGRSFLQADSLVDGKIWKEKSVKNTETRKGAVAWAGLKNRYFTMILNPQRPAQEVSVQQLNKNDMLLGIEPEPLELSPGAIKEARFILYAGPIIESRIAAVDDSMTGVVDYGFFGGVSKILLSVLSFFYGWTGNWGIAIILLTLTINLLLFPLTKKSFLSMQQMKKLQPHMQQLKEKHKDNPQKLNKEMMELYKKYNVNPLGGCLPLLLQMPIFISLYQGLMRSVNLKGANFLWITDLAKPDAVGIPFSLPLIGDSVNILPILMVGAMFLQQKLSQGATAAVSNEQAGQQKMMMVIFPLFFGFLFYKMPSGLVLYWLTNTVLMVTEQTLIAKKHS